MNKNGFCCWNVWKLGALTVVLHGEVSQFPSLRSLGAEQEAVFQR